MLNCSFLLDLAKKSIEIDESMSRWYIQEFREKSQIENIQIPFEIQTLYCNFCNSIFIPGYNCSKSLIPNKKLTENILKNAHFIAQEESFQNQNFKSKIKSKIKSKNKVVFHCKICNNFTVIGASKSSQFHQEKILKNQKKQNSKMKRRKKVSINQAVLKRKKNLLSQKKKKISQIIQKSQTNPSKKKSTIKDFLFDV
ncbi:ribonuclease mrp protein subunit snm1 [Anaeramoeba ignava]|uniref:Ribonuclease mrp protein subunit snm1 n=1 Tax=Anaeramoeba ignava TaxID=1746090 RepID=A0A9Q0LC17_ANAIG|nr:ribonuclease mrp protein subunit snm1 [Anaeramoeba ignava]